MFKKYLMLLTVVIFCTSIVRADEPLIYYWPNGKKKSEEEVKEGIENGKSTYWYESGSKKSEREIKDGKQNGITTIWYENGA